jgi:Tfp pilus assembly protein PilX
VKRLGNDHGAALIMAIALLLLLTAIAGAVAVASRTEVSIVGNVRQGREMLHAAEGAAALVVRDLGLAVDWNTVLTGAAASSFTDGAAIGSRTLPGGDVIVLCCGAGSLTGEVQGRAHGGRSWGPDTPVWQIFAWGPVNSWLPAGRIDSPLYVVAWIADDPDDGDGNPYVDANGFLELHVHALGSRGGRRVVGAIVERPAGGSLADTKVRGWRDVRW